MEIVEVLKRSEIFLGLDDDALRAIASLPSCHRQVYQAGECVGVEGDTSENFYAVVSGRVQTVKEISSPLWVTPKRVIVDTTTTGECFGWSALVPPYTRTATVQCLEPTEVVAISGKELIQLMDKEPRLGYEIMKGLASIMSLRLREVMELLVTGKRLPIA